MYLMLAREPFPALVRAGVYYISCNCLSHSSVLGIELEQCVRKASSCEKEPQRDRFQGGGGLCVLPFKSLGSFFKEKS